MESKVCSRSQGHPPGARSRAMMETARSKRSPVAGIGPNTLNDGRIRGQSKPRPPAQDLAVTARLRLVAENPWGIGDAPSDNCCGTFLHCAELPGWTKVTFPEAPD